MYIWLAIDVNDQVSGLREKAESYVKKFGLFSPTLTLPFHISLKISFRIPDDKFGEVAGDIREFCKSLKPFSITVKGIELNGPILWSVMRTGAELSHIHKKLDEMMHEKYGVEQHAFDKAFLFHMSVLILRDEEQAQKALHALKDADMPKVLRAEKVIIGSSAEGQAGTYRVNEEISLL